MDYLYHSSDLWMPFPDKKWVVTSEDLNILIVDLSWDDASQKSTGVTSYHVTVTDSELAVVFLSPQSRPDPESPLKCSILPIFDRFHFKGDTECSI